MESPRLAARPRPQGSAGRGFDPPIAATGLAAATVATLIIAITLVLAHATNLVWAVPGGILSGIAQIVLLRWRLAAPIEQLERFAQLADHAEGLSRRLIARGSSPGSAGRAPHPPGAAPSSTFSSRPLGAPGGRGAGGHRRDPGRTLVNVINSLAGALDAEHQYRSIVDATGDVVLLVDSLGQISRASGSVSQVLGLAPAQMAGQPLARYVHAGDLEQLLDLLEDFDAEGRTDRRSDRPRLRLRAAGNSWRVLEWVLSRGPSDHPGSTLLTGRDVTEQVALQEELIHQAQHDSLTGLPNRIALTARLAELVGQASADRPVAVLMIDLDRFKVINDSLGHAYGDALLAQVGTRLSAVLRPGDMLARLGGDEFAVVLQTGGLQGAEMVAERLISQLEDAFWVEGARLTVEASIGIAISHPTVRAQPADSATLLSEADIAMYRAKESSSCVAVFEPERDYAKSQRLELSEELRAAIAGGQLVLQYQPIIDIRKARVAGVEALVRWEHPVRGLLVPAEFLPLAEESGMIGRLSLFVLDKMLGQVATWMAEGWPLPTAVNLSPNWLLQADVAAEVTDTLVRHGVPAHLLRLEITEAAVITDPEHSLARLHRLRDMGVGLSLDDFGTGFSSMTHLRTLPIDQLKVDGSFVRMMATSAQDAVIARAAIELGHKLGLGVVAEGVENPDTLARVMGAGCTLAQGFYFAGPMPADQVLDWIRPRFPATAASLVP